MSSKHNVLLRKHESGAALVMAVFVLVMLTGMGVALLFLGQHGSRMGVSNLRVKKAFYLAESGLENGRITMYQLNPDPEFDDDLATAAGPDGTLDFDIDALQVIYDGAGNVTGLSGFNDDVPLRALTGLDSGGSQGWYAAFLTNDPIEGRTALTDANQRVLISAIGMGDHRSLEFVQGIIEPHRFLPPMPPAALTMLGPLPAFFDNGTSNAQSHTGDDCGVAGGPYAPIVGTVSPESKEEVQDDMNRPENFSSGPFTGEDTIADMTDLSDPIVAAAGHGIIDPIWLDCQEMKSLVEQLAVSADYYCNSDSHSCSFPTTGPDDVVFIDGDLSATPSGTYSGILVVTGELTYNGNTGWDGVVLVIGEGRMIRSGGGGGNPSGGVVIANIDPTPDGAAADRSDWCTSGPGGFLQSFYDTSGGGASTVQWCTGLLNAANSVKTYRVVEFLQR